MCAKITINGIILLSARIHFGIFTETILTQQWNSINIITLYLNLTVLSWIIELSPYHHQHHSLSHFILADYLHASQCRDRNVWVCLELKQFSSFQLLGGGHGGVRAIRTLLEDKGRGERRSWSKSDPDNNQIPESVCLLACTAHLHIIQLCSAWQWLLGGKCLQGEAKQESQAWNPNKFLKNKLNGLPSSSAAPPL